MAEPPLGPAATLVRRYDPELFRTALFAPEPERERLMTLYALDIELSRALSRTAEPLISRMHLQFWRDVIEGARAGEAPRAHEIAGPVHALLGEGALPGPLLDGLVEAREMEIEGIGGEAAFDAWADARFGGLVRLAAACAAPGSAEREGVAAAATAAGRALAAAFALRTAAAMAAAETRPLLPELTDESRSHLARAGADANLREIARGVAERGLAGLAAARRGRRVVPAAARVAFLPLGAAEPVLRRVLRRDGDVTAAALAPGPARAAAGTLWRALSGRW